MKIVTLVSQMAYTPEQKRALKKIGKLVHCSVKKIKGNEIVKRIRDADIVIVGSSGVERIDAKVLSKCPKLQFISILGVGTDIVDIKKAAELGVKVSNLRGTNSESVAEHVWGMILSLAKRITESHIGTKAGKYEYKHYSGTELQGKTIGILGFGEIGKRVARIAKGLDMKIFSYTRTHKNAKGVNFVKLEKLLKQADVIVVSLPLTKQTKGLLGTKEFKLMKKGVILVNPAREAIIDKQALLEALASGEMFGFGMELDINTPADKRFYKYPNVLITPHNAFFTTESEQKSYAMAIDNVLQFAAGNPQNLVN